MFDIQVLLDKLNSFQTADEVADFLTQQGVTGQRLKADSCVVTNWLRPLVGTFLTTSSMGVVQWNCNPVIDWDAEPIGEFEHSRAVSAFIIRFDNGEFPHLVTREV